MSIPTLNYHTILFKNHQVSNLYRLPLLESQVKRYMRLLRLLLQFGFNLKKSS